MTKASATAARPRTVLAVAVVAALGLSAATAGTSRAAATTYTTRAAFTSAVGPASYTESFDSLTEGDQGTMTRTFMSGAFSFTASTGAALPNDNDLFRSENQSGTDFALSTTIPSNLTFTFAGGNVTALGGDFSLTNDSFGTAADTFQLMLSDGTTVTRTSGGADGPFFGFTSAVPITSLTFAIPADATPNNYFATVNNFTVGAATAVPEPTSLALAAIGGAGLLARRRRGRA